MRLEDMSAAWGRVVWLKVEQHSPRHSSIAQGRTVWTTIGQDTAMWLIVKLYSSRKTV